MSASRLPKLQKLVSSPFTRLGRSVLLVEYSFFLTFSDAPSPPPALEINVTGKLNHENLKVNYITYGKTLLIVLSDDNTELASVNLN